MTTCSICQGNTLNAQICGPCIDTIRQLFPRAQPTCCTACSGNFSEEHPGYNFEINFLRHKLCFNCWMNWKKIRDCTFQEFLKERKGQ